MIYRRKKHQTQRKTAAEQGWYKHLLIHASREAADSIKHLIMHNSSQEAPKNSRGAKDIPQSESNSKPSC